MLNRASKPPHMFVILVLWLTMTYHCNCHVNHITRTCFYHLRQLRVIRRSLTVDTAHSLVRALGHSRLDYCNEVLAGMHQYQYDRLQSVLRAAARLVLRLPKWASVSEAMRRALHWLPYLERVEFKLCSTIYKCLHNSAPQYLIELCIPVATLPGRCHMRSAAYGDLFVPATSTKTIGPRGFSYAGPVAWNSLQPVLKDPTLSFTMFKKLLKTELFNWISFTTAITACAFVAVCLKGVDAIPV